MGFRWVTDNSAARGSELILIYELNFYIVVNYINFLKGTECSNKHRNSVTNSISSLLRISIVIPDFKSHDIMSAKVHFMKRVNGC